MIRNIAWAAGLFEGEGTIIIRKRPEDQIDLQLASIDRDVIKTFRKVIGFGAVYGPYKYGKRQPYWKWCVYGSDAIACLNSLKLYFLHRRKSRADEAIKRHKERQLRPHYTVSRKGMGVRPRNKQ